MRAIAILIIGALGSCTCGTLSRDELKERYPYAQGTLFSRGGLQPVLDELAAKVGGAVTVTSISVTPGDAHFSVRDPKRPGNLDTWWYDGKRFRDPEPQQTSRSDVEDNRSFAVADVPALGKLRDLIDKTLAELKIENGRIGSVSVSKSDKIQLSIDVAGPRERGYVTFDAQGTLIQKHVN